MGEIFERPLPPEALPWTGERLTSATTGQVAIEHLHRYFFARSLCRGRDVLDIACGEGYGAAMLAQVAASVTAVDVSAECVAHATEAYAVPNLTFVTGDARRIPSADASFDVVVSFETIEHFYEHEQFIAEIRRVLRPGGFLIISSPERDTYSPAGSRPNPYHAHELTRAEFGDLLQRSFQHVSMYGQRPLLGSALVPERKFEGTAAPFMTFERRDERRFEASVGLPRPIYLVAITSDDEQTASIGSLYIETSGVEAIYADEGASRQEIASLRAQLASAIHHVHTLEEIGPPQAHTGALQLQLEVAERDRVQTQSVVEQLQGLLAQRTDQIEAVTQQIFGLEQQARVDAGQRESERAEAEAECASLAEQLRRTEENLRLCEAAYGGLIASSAEQLRKRNERFARLEAAFRAMLNRQTAELEETEARHRAELDRLQNRLAELPKLGALGLAQKAELERLRSYVAELEYRLNAVLSSTSWHLTGPFRGFTQRHPGSVERVRKFLHKHPAVRRKTVGLVRAGWRAVTLRNPVVPRRLPGEEQPGRPDAPAQAPRQPPPVVELKFAAIERVARAREKSLPAGGRRKALCIGHVMPYPPRAGNEYRIHRLLSWFAEAGWELLVVICPLPHEMPSRDQIAGAAAIYPNLLILERDGTLHHNLQANDGLLQHDPGRWRPKLERLLEQEGDGADRILNLQRTFCPDVLVPLLFHLEERFAPDLLLAEYIFMTRSFPLLDTRLRKAVDTIDVFSAKGRKVEQFAVTDGLALTAAEEATLLQRADILIAIQPEEAHELAQLAPKAKVVSVGVDFPVMMAEEVGTPGRTILLVASGNPMNVKGLEDFLQFAWPTVRRYEPEAEFVIAGSAADSMLALPEGVRALGRVDDLRPVYADARLVINPAVAGTGLKIKTVEALCHLRPVVCWPAGVEGLPVEVRRFCTVSTDWFNFARNVTDHLQAEATALAVRHARDEIARVFSPEFVYAPLSAALQDA